MSVPDFQTLMLPVMKISEDGQEHVLSDVVESLADQFKLSETDRREMLPSERQPRFHNRVNWAVTYLKKAGLVESRGRGRFRIAERGRDLLRNNPPKINMKLLEQFEEFVEFRKFSREKEEPAAREGEAEQTPEETLESSYQALRRNLASELLERAKKCSPRFFEKLVVDLLVRMGYGGSLTDAGQAVGQSGDGAIDGIIKEDKLGLDVAYIQAKRWENTVGRPVVQAFAGSLEGQRARKGVLITTSQFSPEAREYVGRIEKKIVLIDGAELAQLMIDHEAGVSDVISYSLKRVDADYYEEE